MRYFFFGFCDIYFSYGNRKDTGACYIEFETSIWKLFILITKIFNRMVYYECYFKSFLFVFSLFSANENHAWPKLSKRFLEHKTTDLINSEIFNRFLYILLQWIFQLFITFSYWVMRIWRSKINQRDLIRIKWKEIFYIFFFLFNCVAHSNFNWFLMSTMTYTNSPECIWSWRCYDSYF
jgi:hypothetical protein